MSHQSVTYSNEQIEKMKTHYTNFLENPPPYAIFRARVNGAVIIAYESGKVVFQGNNWQEEAEKWGDHDELPDKQIALFPTEELEIYSPPESLFTSNHIGSDESGTGDYFGPITTCAVYVQKEQIELLKEKGIQDSKTITDTNIQLLAKGLLEMDIPYSLLILHNEKYNKLQASGWSQGKMKAMLHHSALENVLEKIGNKQNDGILIDQFCTPSVYEKYLASEGKTLPNGTYFKTKAESYSIAVAAASIIARASFLNEMERLSNEVGHDLLKGASQKVDELIAKIVKEKGKNILYNIAKVHFANTKKAENFL